MKSNIFIMLLNTILHLLLRKVPSHIHSKRNLLILKKSKIFKNINKIRNFWQVVNQGRKLRRMRICFRLTFCWLSFVRFFLDEVFFLLFVILIKKRGMPFNHLSAFLLNANDSLVFCCPPLLR